MARADETRAKAKTATIDLTMASSGLSESVCLAIHSRRLASAIRRSGSTVRVLPSSRPQPDLQEGDANDACSAIVLRSTSKISAVDQPNSRTPFIAVIGPKRRHRATGVISP